MKESLCNDGCTTDYNFVCIITKQRKYTLKVSLFSSQVDNYQDLLALLQYENKKIPRISNKNTAWDNHSWFPKINPSRNLLHFKYRKKSGRRQFHASSTTISFFDVFGRDLKILAPFVIYIMLAEQVGSTWCVWRRNSVINYNKNQVSISNS